MRKRTNRQLLAQDDKPECAWLTDAAKYRAVRDSRRFRFQ